MSAKSKKSSTKVETEGSDEQQHQDQIDPGFEGQGSPIEDGEAEGAPQAQEVEGGEVGETQEEVAAKDERFDYAIVLKLPARYKIVFYTKAKGKGGDTIAHEGWAHNALEAESMAVRGAKEVHKQG